MSNSAKPRKRASAAPRRPAPRRSHGDQRAVMAAIIICLALGVIAWAVTKASDSAEAARAANTASGHDLTAVVTNPALHEQMIENMGMTISFNPATHQPNWVAWELLGSETDGEEPRGNFSADPRVQDSAVPADYTRSGYDRGHMAPAGDMKWHPKAMEESFYMTNISPQAGELNRGAWKKLEEKCRQRAVVDSSLIIVCGPIFEPGEGVQRIGATGVAVPRRFFKVILAPWAAEPYAIGFVMPNSYVKGGMQACAVTVDSVETLTGHDFFSALPDDLERRLESQVNFQAFSKIRARK